MCYFENPSLTADVKICRSDHKIDVKLSFCIRATSHSQHTTSRMEEEGGEIFLELEVMTQKCPKQVSEHSTNTKLNNDKDNTLIL